MNAELLLAQFNRISNAPDAVPRLRQFVLDLAVRGKLVEQDPKDEPAPALLRTIRAEKARLAKLDKITSLDASSAVESDEQPFDLPANWSWTRLVDICSKTGSGSTPRGGKEVYQKSGVPFLRSQNVYDDGLRLDDVAYIEIETHSKMSGTSVEPNDLLLNITGGSIGRCCIAPDGLGPANVSQHVAIIRLPIHGIQGYLHRLILSPYFQKFVFNEQTGAGRGGLPKNRMDAIPVALPPLDEQHRIVAKVDELMALCDRLEAAQRERESRRDQLAASTHHHLNNGANAEALRSHAQFFIGNLSRITARPDQIKLVRQTILNLAVQGKLVEQSPNDEPTLELFERIHKAKKQLASAKKLKKIYELEFPNEDEMALRVPASWRWTRLANVYDVRDGTHDTPKYVDAGYPLITSKNLSTGRLSFDNFKLISEQDHHQISERSAVEKGDVLLAMIGSIGNPAIVDTDRPFSIKNVALFKHYDRSLSNSGFLCIFLQHATGQMLRQATGGLQPFVSLGFLRSYPIPIPPLAEQHRIVAKVDELMALCDKLEAQLTAAQTEASRLLESVLHNALNSPIEQLESVLSV